MATTEHVRLVQDLIKYDFGSTDFAVIALTAAGADENYHDGNRSFADYGRLLIEFYLLDQNFIAGLPRNTSARSSVKATHKETQAAVAKEKGIDSCIKYCPRQGGQPPSATVLSLAIRAIVGAVWVDSGRKNEVAYAVIEQLGIAEERDSELYSAVVPQSPNFTMSSISPRPLRPVYKTSYTSQPDLSCWSLDERGIHSPSLFLPMRTPDPEENLLTYPQFFHSYERQSTSSILEDFEQMDLVDTSSISQVPPVVHGMTALFGSAAHENPRIGLGSENLFPELFNHFEGFNTQISTPQLSIQTQPVDIRASNHSFVSTPGCVGYPQSSLVNPSYNASLQPSRATEHPIKRQHGCEESRSHKRRRVSRQNVNILLLLNGYLSEETRKCKDLRIPYDSDLYCPLIADGWINGLEKEDRQMVVRLIFAKVASCDSIILLRDLVTENREKTLGLEPCPVNEMSIKQRISFIERLGKRIAYCEFLRRCHIWRLYTESCPPEHKTRNMFVAETFKDGNTAKKLPGNPRHRAEAEITQKMFDEIYPSLQKADLDYAKKYREFTEMRKLGKRLHLLTSTFGSGILGLLPVSCDRLYTEFNIRASSDMLALLREDDFKQLVHFLDKAQGSMLKKFSAAVHDIVEGIFHDKLAPTERYLLELVDKNDISKYPKGSEELLALVCKSQMCYTQSS